MKRIGLSRHLAMLMMQVTCLSIVISFAVYYVGYGISELFSRRGITFYQPSSQEWVMLAVSTAMSLTVAIVTAVRFARRVLLPLNSLAESARKIAGGELSARAEAGDRQLAETAELVDDFNTMAEKLESASGEIAMWNAAIAHELRTPVTILRGRLTGLADGVFEPSHALFVNLVRQTDGLARLIEDLRTLSLAESGHMLLHCAQTEMSREICYVADLMRPALAERKISLVLRLDDIALNCDGARVRQALLALLENVRRYTDAGIVMVSCLQSGDEVVITVDDEGPGIPAEIRSTLFNAFIRGEQSRSRESGGSGLGLAVVQAIMKAHNGTVSCGISEFGGASFRLVFPAIAQSDKTVPAHS